MKIKADVITKNHIIIDTTVGLYLQSNESIIAFIPSQQELPIQLDENKWDDLRSIGTHRNSFLAETKRETEKKIANGKYILTDLN